MTTMEETGVRVVRPGGTYVGAQGFTYGAGASAQTVGAQSICMNILPMPHGRQAKVHYHDKIETIAYLLTGECRVYFGPELEHSVDMSAGEQIYIPADVVHAPCNRSGADCSWIVVHSSGSDQEGIVMLPELDKKLEAV